MNIKMKKFTLILFLLYLGADHCLWLVNSGVQNNITEMYNIIIPCLLIFCFRKNIFFDTINERKYQFGHNILFFLVMGAYSSIQAYLLYGQSIVHTFLLQRSIITGFLLYFVLMWYINHKPYALESLTRMIFLLAALELVIYIAQYLLVNQVRFLQCSYNIRMNEVRMNLGAMAVPFVIFFTMNSIYRNERITWKEILVLGAGLFYSFEVAKTRIVLVAYPVAFIAGYLLWKKGGKKKMAAFFILLGFIFFLTQTELFSFLIDGLNNKDPSAQTRTVGRMLYSEHIMEHPVLGCGYIFLGNAKARAYAGVDSGIYWVDLGVYGIAFFYGFIGIIWLIMLYGKMLIRAFGMAKKGNYTFWMYIVYLIILSPNGTGYMWYVNNTFGLVLWICLLEGNYKKMQLENSSNKYDSGGTKRHVGKDQTIDTVKNT